MEGRGHERGFVELRGKKYKEWLKGQKGRVFEFFNE